MDEFVPNLFLTLEPIIFSPYFRIGFLVFSVFLIIIMYGMVRKHYFHMTMKGANFGFLAGMLTVIIIEVIGVVGFLYGKHTLEIISGKQKPQEILEMTKDGVNKVNKVLGVQTCTQPTFTVTSMLEQLPQLSQTDEKKIKAVLCR